MSDFLSESTKTAAIPAFDITKPISVTQDAALALLVLRRFNDGSGPLTPGDAGRIALAIERMHAERDAIRAEIINTPETADFMAGVPLEAVHQRERWGAEHDAGKQPLDWFWLIGYLAQKAADAAMRGDLDKAKHHTISTAAALANWHAALAGADTSMRPGIEPPDYAG